MKRIAKFHKVSFEQFAEGFADYIIKPVQRKNLCEIIGKYTNNICKGDL